jgi:hypothetical protein
LALILVFGLYQGYWFHYIAILKEKMGLTDDESWMPSCQSGQTKQGSAV